MLKAFDALLGDLKKKVAKRPEPGFRIQLSSIKSSTRSVADQEASRLTRKFSSLLGSLSVTPIRADIADKGTFYRMQVGPRADMSSARALCEKLSDLEQDCLVIEP